MNRDALNGSDRRRPVPLSILALLWGPVFVAAMHILQAKAIG
jgi:hypothetical protein